MNDNQQIQVLIAEDHEPTTTLLKLFLEKNNYSVLSAANGQIASDLFQSSDVDLVLTDINMPVKNGLELISDIRQHKTDIWVPIIILSANGDDESIVHGLEAGADDYLPKPISLKILQAKLETMTRMIALQKLNRQALQQLAISNQALEQEQHLAKKLADNILDMSDLDRDGVNHWLCPSSIFSGDLIAVQMALDGKLYVMLADSSGHGLAAALPTLAVAKTFHRMLNEGFSLQRTLQEINHETQQMLPTNRFLAAVAFAIDYEHQLIECWNGGFPPVFIVNRQNDIVHQFKSEHLALGIVGKDTFETHTDIYQWNEEVELLAYSDGLVEATDDQGQAFGERLLMQLINESTVADRVAVLKNAVFEHIQAEQSDDDISIISICCDKLK